jgi:D-serine dehydratase
MAPDASPVPLALHADWMLDDGIRGVPVGVSGLPASAVPGLGWHPAEGLMQLPVLTLDEDAFVANRDLLIGHFARRGVSVAPHAKTPMSPDIALSLVDAGAWGTTVADIRQAAVMIRAGLDRLILANEVGGTGGARRLAALVEARPDAELYVFADSVAAAGALAQVWRERPDLPPLRVLPELGAGRAGARTPEAFEAVADTILSAGGRLVLSGVAAYEGSAGRATPAETRAAIDGLLEAVVGGLALVRRKVGPDRPLLVTAGGSGWFDVVIDALKPAVDRDGSARLVVRSGALFFHDHGVYERALRALDERGGFDETGAAALDRFRPSLRVWAEVLSRPEPDLAICGMGMRDVSFDQGFPVAVRVHRAGVPLATDVRPAVVQLNDQHAYCRIDRDADLKVGDVVEFGISHPCTCLDRYRAIFALDRSCRVRNVFRAHFG